MLIPDIKHKHAAHIIIIEGQAFKADDHGRWNLTDIWRTLKLHVKKGPGKWAELKEAQRLTASGKVESVNGDNGGTWAAKQATIRYAAWVSPDVEDMVYDAFEAILELPDIALIVADKMAELGNDHSATILKRHVFNDKCDWAMLKGPHVNSQAGLRNAVKRGNLTRQRAAELGLKGVRP